MPIYSDDWQTKRVTIRERSKFMFNYDLLSDVKFVVRRSNGDSERKKVIPAHKFVLSISSPVFLAMFYGDLAETTDSIDLPDCEYEGLLELFRYMYSDEVKLSGNNVMQVLYLAKKYIVPSLVDKCTGFLRENLDVSNVFCVLPDAQKYEEKELEDWCWKVIDTQTDEAIKSDRFVTIQRSLLEEVVKRDSLYIEEVELFKAVHSWATKECERQSLVADGDAKRRILGEGIVRATRFPVMREKDFAHVVLDCKILTPDETYDLVKYFNSVLSTAVGFPEAERTGFLLIPKRCCRFGSVLNLGWTYSYFGSCQDRLVVSVDKDIVLHGVRLCGSQNCEYSVTLKIKLVTSDSSCDVLASKTGKFLSEHAQSESGDFYGFDVLFDFPVAIKKGIKYCIEASIIGVSSWRGENGFGSVKCSDVTFNFEESNESNNGTSIVKGQFPEIVFSLK